MTVRLLTSVAFALLPMLAWGEGYICAADMATGFAYRNGGWHQGPFKPDSKFLVRRLTQDEQAAMSAFGGGGLPDKWKIMQVGLEFPIALCSDDFQANGELFCGDSTIMFRVNKRSLRFLYAYLAGYTTPGNEGADTPAIFIGKCSPM